ncbi:MAG: glycoside hydrolase family 31 protein, partial [Clostridiales bacterium]|nr:glycoside hydrolase family 31 protein [Candidatus Blautia equi]
MKFGKLLSFKTDGNRVLLHFEKKDGRVEILTEKILNVFAGFLSEEHRSKAIEGEKVKETAFTAKQQGEAVVISTAAVTVKVYDDFKVDFYAADGTVLCKDYRGERTELPRISEAMIQLMESEGHQYDKEAEDAFEVLKELEGDESFYGLGDKTGFMDKAGYEYVMWNSDLPDPQVDSFKSLYKSVPFFITRKKNAVFGLFFDNSYRTTFDMGKEDAGYFRYAAKDGNLDYYLIYGENMPEVLSGYTYLTGTVPVPQKWTLGYQQSRWGYITEEEIRALADKMRDNEIPCDVIHLDIDYMEGYRVFTWNKDRYADPEKCISDLAEKGIKIVCIIDPGVKLDEGYEVYDTGVEKGY